MEKADETVQKKLNMIYQQEKKVQADERIKNKWVAQNHSSQRQMEQMYYSLQFKMKMLKQKEIKDQDPLMLPLTARLIK